MWFLSKWMEARIINTISATNPGQNLVKFIPFDPANQVEHPNVSKT